MSMNDKNIKLYITHNNIVQEPIVEEGIQWETERKGSPGKLTFSILKDNIINFQEGDAVRFEDGENKVFFGFVFDKHRDKSQKINVTAYDQIRYFKNQDTEIYTNKIASEVVTMLAEKNQLNVGTIEKTEFVIASRCEDNQTYIDMIQNALDLELTNKKKMYVLYDDFGKLCLKNIENMKIPIVINEETGENYDYSSSIDLNTYNQIKLIYENEETGKREVYIAKDTSNINKWGVLQYFEKIDEKTNGKSKADALLELYNKKTRNLKVQKAFGDSRVRSGCMVIVELALGDINVQNWMIVERAVHKYMNGKHEMDLTLRGGDFIA